MFPTLQRLIMLRAVIAENNELEMEWKEDILMHFKTRLQHLFLGYFDNHKIPYSGQLASRLRFELRAFWCKMRLSVTLANDKNNQLLD
jgi:hypothetical protein